MSLGSIHGSVLPASSSARSGSQPGYRHRPRVPGCLPSFLQDQLRLTAPPSPPGADDSLRASGCPPWQHYGLATGYGEVTEPDILSKGCVVRTVRRGVQSSRTRVKVSTPLSSVQL